ncbi:MAG: hypothetical protein ACMUHB_04225 [Thermoplasmatota archaeon]
MKVTDPYQWSEEETGMRRRETARSREMSPCSEYTRYTAEGILKDPWSPLSARFDVETLGILFSNSSFHEPRWSERLGYGMAVIGEDTRVHLHQNGKYVIRRALDREHAESSYRLIIGLLRPVLMDDRSAKPLWYLLRKFVIDGNGQTGNLAPLIGWPDLEDAPASAVEEVMQGIRTMDDIMLSGLRSSIREGQPGDGPSSVIVYMERFKGEIANAHGMSATSPFASLGRMSALVWCYKALEEWKVLQEESPGGGPGTDLARSRLSFLLHPL